MLLALALALALKMALVLVLVLKMAMRWRWLLCRHLRRCHGADACILADALQCWHGRGVIC
jgi:hypothetical protein